MKSVWQPRIQVNSMSQRGNLQPLLNRMASTFFRRLIGSQLHYLVGALGWPPRKHMRRSIGPSSAGRAPPAVSPYSLLCLLRHLAAAPLQCCHGEAPPCQYTPHGGSYQPAWLAQWGVPRPGRKVAQLDPVVTVMGISRAVSFCHKTLQLWRLPCTSIVA